MKVFDNSDFGYQRIVIERPKIDKDDQPIRNRKGLVPDADLRDTANVPLTQDLDDYMKAEVLPHVPDAWIDRAKTKIGYEVPFTRNFYSYTPPRSVGAINKEVLQVEEEIQRLLIEVTQ